MKVISILSFALFSSLALFGQDDMAKIQSARTALDASRNCAEANKQLNLVSPEYRQTAEYLLCMARTQDCMNNKEQALYYYGKVIALQPANDSVKRRAAELKDAKAKTERSENEINNAAESYQAGTKGNTRKRKPRKNLMDNYGSYALGYGMGIGGDKSPYKSAGGFSLDYGFLIAKERAVLEWSFGVKLLVNPNDTWFSSTIQLPYGTPVDATGDMGWSYVWTAGFYPILVNKKHHSLAAGLFVGGDLYSAGLTSGYASTEIKNSLSLCFGPKVNLYLGEHFMVFSNLLLHSSNKARVTSTLGDFTIPTSYNSFNIGIAIKADTWW